MVDTVKILGALLGGGGLSSGSGSDILKSVLGAATSGQSSGGLGDLLGSVLGGLDGGAGKAGGSGGLGGMLGSVLGGAQSQGGDPGGMLGGMLGGKSSSSAQAGAGLNDLLGGVLGGGQGSAGGADLGSLLESALSQFGHAEQAAQNKMQLKDFSEHSPNLIHSEVSDQATLMIRAMINAAKSDGRVDQKEQEQILGKLGSISQDEIDFVNDELTRPLDVEGFAASVPAGMQNQVYAMSLMAIDLDSNKEAQYLHQLASSMQISPESCNQIHQQLGVPELYS